MKPHNESPNRWYLPALDIARPANRILRWSNLRERCARACRGIRESLESQGAVAGKSTASRALLVLSSREPANSAFRDAPRGAPPPRSCPNSRSSRLRRLPWSIGRGRRFGKSFMHRRLAVSVPLEGARLARFKRPPFHQRVAPAPQSRDVHVNPVIPPVHLFRREIEKRALPRRQRGRKQPRVFALEDMFIVKDERLVKLDQFFRANQVALSLGKRRLLEVQGCGCAIDSRDHGFLHRNRQPLVALFRDGDGLEFHLQPVLDALRAAVILAVREPGQLNTAPHV